MLRSFRGKASTFFVVRCGGKRGLERCSKEPRRIGQALTFLAVRSRPTLGEASMILCGSSTGSREPWRRLRYWSRSSHRAGQGSRRADRGCQASGWKRQATRGRGRSRRLRPLSRAPATDASDGYGCSSMRSKVPGFWREGMIGVVATPFYVEDGSGCNCGAAGR